MRTLVDRLQHRLLPAILAAVGVSLIAAGLLDYTTSVAATAVPSGAPTSAPLVSPRSTVRLTFPPLASASPDGSPSTSSGVVPVVSRVVVPALGIDLPVIRQPGGANAFPPCNVAMYLLQLHQPSQPGPTYLYAHARTGMFLPILEASRIGNGRRMKGMLIQVYTADDQLYLYQVVEIRRHVTTLDAALADKRDSVWLQTSEGPVGTIEKTQVIALPLSHGPADHKEANPKPNPVSCH